MEYNGGAVMNGVDWDYFDRYREVIDRYMPDRGEGDSIASQICTAVNKLIYKWYNDGDVYDNTKYLDGWCNDLSSYANWLYNHDYGKGILENVFYCRNGAEYELVLKLLADEYLGDEVLLDELSKVPANESIYTAKGVFRFVDSCDDEDDEY